MSQDAKIKISEVFMPVSDPFPLLIQSGLLDKDGFVEPEELLPTLKPGDLIEFNRGAYKHWGMYSDKSGYVFNICSEDKNMTNAKITLEELVHVANLGGHPELRKVRVNNKENSSDSRGLKARPVKDSLAEAKSLVNSFVPYDFTSINCEYYCTKWRYGKGFTDQAEYGQRAIYGTIGGMVGGSMGGEIGHLAGSAIGNAYGWFKTQLAQQK